MILSTSILSADFACLGEQIKITEQAGTDWFHFDIMDGAFVPNITMGPFIVQAVRKLTPLPFDVHLMIENPDRYIETFAKAGANIMGIHIENTPNIHRIVQNIRSLGCSPTVVINPGTAACSLDAILPYVDNVLVMTVNPGFSAQTFIPGMVDKIREIRDMIQSKGLNVKIQVDGGINVETIGQVTQAGAEIIVAANAIFGYPKGIAEGIKILRAAAQ
jgi:ribulose-phosphate 3-epimerase